MDREIPKEERRKAIRRQIIRWTSGIAILAILGGTALSFLRSSISRKEIIEATAERGEIEASITATGKVTPAFEEIITSPISSRIVDIYCKAGDSVDAGTPLLRLDLQATETEVRKLEDQRKMKQYEEEQQKLNNHTYLSNLRMQIEVKEMNVSRLAAEVDNERYLDSLGSGTGDRIRQAELAYETARLELAQLRQQLRNEEEVRNAGGKMTELDISVFDRNLGEIRRTLEDARIKSPRQATLTFIANEIGKRVSAGEQIAVISDLTHFKVDAQIADAYISKILPGAPAVVRSGKEKIRGHISNVTPQSTNGVISFSIALDNDNHPRLRSGLKIDVYIMYDVIEDVVRIPNGSYYSGPGDYEMFVEETDGELRRRKMRLGDSNYDWVEVQSGLSPGEKVVISDMSSFRERNKLKIK